VSRRAAGLAAIALAAFGMAGCSTISETASKLNPFSSSTPKIKVAELAPIQATIDLRLNWQAGVGAAGDYVFTPAVVGETVFAAAADGTVARYDGGRQVWRVAAGQPLSGGVGADEKTVVVGTPKGEVLVFDAASGKELWKARVSSEVLAAPAVADGLVVVRSGDSRIFGFDQAEEVTVALPKGATELERISDITSVPVVDGRHICAAAFQGRVACFDLSNGSMLWARDLSSSAGIDMDDRSVYVSDDKGVVHAFDRQTGASQWKQEKLTNRGLSRPLVLGKQVAVADVQGYVHLLGRDDGAFAARLATDGSAVLSEPRRLAGGLLVQTRNGGLFALARP